jgi:hypothetical protein
VVYLLIQYSDKMPGADATALPKGIIRMDVGTIVN